MKGPARILILLGALVAAIPLGVRADDHAMENNGGSAGAVTLSAFDARIEQSAAGYQQKYPSASIARIVLFDFTMPRDRAEYEATGKNAVLLLSALSHVQNELPLAAAYMGGVKLKSLGSIARATPPSSKAWATFGPYRSDSFYLVPVALLRKDPTVTVDFAKNRSGFMVRQEKFDEPDFVASDADPRSNPKPALPAIKRLIDREYPGFGIEPSL